MASASSVPDPQSDTLIARWSYFPTFISLLWKIGKRELVLDLALAVADGLLPLYLLLTLRNMLNSIVNVLLHHARFSTALVSVVLFSALTCLSVAFAALQTWLGESIRNRLQSRAQSLLLSHVARLPLHEFEDPRLYDQYHRAQNGLDTRLVETMSDVLTLPAAIITATSLLLFVGKADWIFPAILVLGVLPVVLVGNAFYQKKWIQGRRHTQMERQLHYLDRLMTRRDAAPEIRLFGLQDTLLSKRNGLFNRLRSDRMDLARREMKVSLFSALGTPVTVACVVVGAVALIAQGQLSVGDFAAYLGCVEAFSAALFGIFGKVSGLNNDLRYLRDLLHFITWPTEPLHSRARDGQETGEGKEGIPFSRETFENGNVTMVFEEVAFAYPSSASPVLKSVSFTMRSGETVALVGANGAGKTTLAKILMKLYKPISGRVLVNGVDLQEIDTDSWRGAVSAVFQDFLKYEVSVGENITFGQISMPSDAAQMELAASKSGARDFIARLPQQFQTPLGKTYAEAGHDLSVGQWQKLAVCRAYYRDAELLILDEPTAALDARSEVEIYKQFQEMARNKTVLLISHRLGSARLADQILFLQDGAIAEQGTHAELLERDGLYCQFYKIQSSWYS